MTITNSETIVGGVGDMLAATYDPQGIGADAFDRVNHTSVTVTPPQITADQNDYNPTGLSTASHLRLSSDAYRQITGLQGGAAGRILTVTNVGSNQIDLVEQSGSSSAANRFRTPSGNWAALLTGVTCFLVYDSTSSLWDVVIPLAGASQSTMESASTNGAAATPFNAHFHPAAAKCWGEFNGNSTTILASYNITSVADTATGQMTVTIANDFSSANWACFVSRAEDDLTLVYSATYNAKAAGTVVLNSVVEGGGGSDPSSSSGNASWSFAGFGDL